MKSGDRLVLSLRWLLILALLLNSLSLVMQWRSTSRSVAAYRQEIQRAAQGTLARFANGRQLMDILGAENPSAALARALEQAGAAELFENLILLHGDAQVLAALQPPVQPPLPVSRIGDSGTMRDSQRVFVLYQPLRWHRPMMPHMRAEMRGEQSRNRNVPWLDPELDPDRLYALAELPRERFDHFRSQRQRELALALVVQLSLFGVFGLGLRFLGRYRQAQTELIRLERQAQSARFTNMLAHEIRNPLSALQGLLQFGATRTADARIRESLERAQSEARRLERIVGDFLDFGRLRQVQAEPCRIGGVLDRTRELLESDLADAELGWNQQGEDFEVHADPDLLLQVLVNLMLNARQAAPAGSAIDARLNAGSRILRLENAWVCPDEFDVQRLFEPFYTTGARGTGLGLAICRKLLEDQGFRIEARPTDRRFAIEIDFGGST